MKLVWFGSEIPSADSWRKWREFLNYHTRSSPLQTRTELIFGFVGDVSAVDALLEDGRRLEHHDPARRDRHFLAGLRVAADPLALLANHERTKRGQLHRFASFEAGGDLPEHQFHQRSGFRA